MTARPGPWPEIRTYHPDDPFAPERERDGQSYVLDHFFTKLLRLPEMMKTQTGRAMAECRLAFLSRFLQELQQELAEGGYGYEMPDEVIDHLLWHEWRSQEQQQEQPAEDLQETRLVAIHHFYQEQHSA